MYFIFKKSKFIEKENSKMFFRKKSILMFSNFKKNISIENGILSKFAFLRILILNVFPILKISQFQ